MKTIFILLISLLTNSLYAQLMSFNDYFIDNKSIFNPASVSSGSHDVYIGATYRKQWQNLPDGPKSYFIRGEYEPYSIASTDNNFGVGGYLIHDQAGLIGLTGAYVKGNYIIPLSKTRSEHKLNLSIGLTGGIVQYRIDALALSQHVNTIVEADNLTVIYPDMGLGFYFFNDLFHIGLSTPQVMGIDTEYKIQANNFHTKRLRHYYFNLGGRFYIKDDVKFQPDLWIRYVPGQTSVVNFNTLFHYEFDNPTLMFGGGLSFKNGVNNAMIFTHNVFIGVELTVNHNTKQGCRIGFTYSNTSAIYGNLFGATFETSLAYMF